MSKRELRSLTDSATPVVVSMLWSGRRSKMGDEPNEEVERLQALLDEAQAAVAEKERQLAEAKETYEKARGDAEVTFARQRDEQVAAVKMECELEEAAGH